MQSAPKISELSDSPFGDEAPVSAQQHVPADEAHGNGGDTDHLSDQSDEQPFRILGYNNGIFYYFPERLKQVVAMSASGHNFPNLLNLAAMDWFQENYGSADTNPSKIALLAANSLMAACMRKGVFQEEDMCRGAGVWQDANRMVLHCGDKLYVDGAERDFGDMDGDYTYVAASRLVRPAKPLDNHAAHMFRKICEAPSWANKMSGSLLAGWCVMAPLAASLSYRPHGYLTGESDSGKSTIINKIIKPALGKFALCVDGGTTEPAIREAMGYNARPLVFDEAEGEDGRQNMAGVLELARKASSGAVVRKFGRRPFTAQFCALFSAINPPVDKTADLNRMSFFVLRKNRTKNAMQEYEDLLMLIKETITPDFSERLLTRTLQNFASIKANVDTFQIAARRELNAARASWQIGTLLAGVYSLGRTDIITPEAATKFIQENQWQDHAMINQDGDPIRLVQHICSSIIRYTPTTGSARDESIAELISLALEMDKPAEKLLRNYGVIAKHSGIVIANTSHNMAKLLRETDWAKGWKRPLLDLEGAQEKKSVYFQRGVNIDSVVLPVELFRGETFI